MIRLGTPDTSAARLTSNFKTLNRVAPPPVNVIVCRAR
jgi:hypothetical protein